MFVPKLKNPSCSSFWEIFDTYCPMYYTGVRDGKKGKRSQKISIANFFWLLFSFFHQILQPSAILEKEKKIQKQENMKKLLLC